jgi:hypothetical protein
VSNKVYLLGHRRHEESDPPFIIRGSVRDQQPDL